MKTDLKTTIALLMIFIVTVIGTLLFAIYVLSTISTLKVTLISGPTNSLFYLAYLIAALLVGTAMVLFAIKRKMFRTMRVVFVIITGLILFSFFSFFLSPILVIAATVISLTQHLSRAKIHKLLLINFQH
ncbi:MAG: hypothetical protein OH316_01455 [Candidatus Parvarchaeota archaeon]|nr:hypothetical protein [Candidatus Parvarchaeota archaeon]